MDPRRLSGRGEPLSRYLRLRTGRPVLSGTIFRGPMGPALCMVSGCFWPALGRHQQICGHVALGATSCGVVCSGPNYQRGRANFGNEGRRDWRRAGGKSMAPMPFNELFNNRAASESSILISWWAWNKRDSNVLLSLSTRLNCGADNTGPVTESMSSSMDGIILAASNGIRQHLAPDKPAERETTYPTSRQPSMSSIPSSSSLVLDSQPLQTPEIIAAKATESRPTPKLCEKLSRH